MLRVLPRVLPIILLLLAAPASTIAQPRRTSADIQAQIQKSAELQRRALQHLTDPERAERLVNGAAAELQSALRAMMINAAGRKAADPLLDFNVQRIRQALAHLQQASDTFKANRPGAGATHGQKVTPTAESRSYLSVVRNSVEQALRITDTVLVL